MSSPQTFLLCDSIEHAEVVDTFIMESLRERDGAQGSSWSGVWTDGVSFGVLWADPASNLFGDPEEDPSLILIEDIADEWSLMEPPDPEPV